MRHRLRTATRRPVAKRGVCAVVVTHNPDSGWPSRLYAVRSQVSAVVVVDNGSARPPDIRAGPRGRVPVVLLRSRRNRGIAAALNRGFLWAKRKGFEWVLTLDQDSLPQPGMTAALYAAFERHPEADRIALAAPRGRDPMEGYEMRFLQPAGVLGFRYLPCRGRALDDVTFVNNSGCLHRASVHSALGGFREELFLDYVDTDYCLRARRAGYRILVVCRAQLTHQVGRRRERRFWGAAHYPTFHDPQRWYYIGRNRIPMWIRHAWHTPHWAIYDAVAGTYSLFRMIAFEDRRWEKVKMSVRGVWDGLRGRMGPLAGEGA